MENLIYAQIVENTLEGQFIQNGGVEVISTNVLKGESISKAKQKRILMSHIIDLCYRRPTFQRKGIYGEIPFRDVTFHH